MRTPEKFRTKTAVDDQYADALRIINEQTEKLRVAEAKLAKIEAHARAHYWDDLELRDLLGAGDDDKETP